MQQKPSFSRSEPTWNGAAPVAAPPPAARAPAPAELSFVQSVVQPVPPAREQRPEPSRAQAPVPRRRAGWVVGLVVVVGLCVVALLLALMIQVASDQVQRNQQQPATRIIGR